ncbi:MAG TPA: hypothetical protein VG986_14350 [Pseudolabrys sp.]|nr:hypothetical protein [Pseudolabrys sp.]
MSALGRVLLVLAALAPLAAGAAEDGGRLDGFNVIESPRHPFGSRSAARSVEEAQRLGARALAIVPFLWQGNPQSVAVVRGNDMNDDQLRAAIREVHKAGMVAIVKPQVWVPESWAGAIGSTNDVDWSAWFKSYGDAMAQIAQVAADEKADALVVGTELVKTSDRPEWTEMIARLRGIFAGKLFYVAQNIDEANRVSFWPQLDAIGISLYPPLGADDDRAGRLKVMRDTGDALDRLASRFGKPIIVGEVGLRSAKGAAAKPWESAEERAAPPDPLLQAEVLGDWLQVLHRPSVKGVLVWRWFSDPGAGGPGDTDFTVQGKPATGVLLCAWRLGCERP